MIEITATGDTTLHTAGKYCAEDILVKVPAGGSSGGAAVETCTVTISGNAGYIQYGATSYENGQITSVAYYGETAQRVDETLILNNVICGSYIYFVNGISMVEPGITTTDGAEIISAGILRNRDYHIKASTTPGVSATVTFVDND